MSDRRRAGTASSPRPTSTSSRVGELAVPPRSSRSSRVMAEALSTLPLPRLSVQVNNRKLIQGFYRGLGIPDITAAIRTIDKLDKLSGRRGARDCWFAMPGLTEEQAEHCLRLADDPDAGHQLRRPGPGASASTDELLDIGSRGARGRRRGLPRPVVAGRVDVEANLRIARGLDYYTGTVLEIFMSGLRAAEVRRRRRSVRRPGLGRQDDVPRGRRLLRHLAHAGAAVRRRRARRQPRRCPPPYWSPSWTRTSRPISTAIASACAPGASRARSPDEPAEVRPADPLRRAPRHPVRLVPRGRRVRRTR